MSVGVFFVFCFGMGKLINNGLEEAGRPVEQVECVNRRQSAGKLKNMESNPAGEQQQLKQLTQTFPDAAAAER